MDTTKPLYQVLANRIDAYWRCDEWRQQARAASTVAAKEREVHWIEQKDKHAEVIEALVKKHLPSGSGFDSGSRLDYGASHGNKLVFATSYHHMNDNGMYTRWTEHKIIVKPHLTFEFETRVTGRNHNGIKDYISETIHVVLNTPIPKEEQ